MLCHVLQASEGDGKNLFAAQSEKKTPAPQQAPLPVRINWLLIHQNECVQMKPPPHVAVVFHSSTWLLLPLMEMHTSWLQPLADSGRITSGEEVSSGRQPYYPPRLMGLGLGSRLSYRGQNYIGRLHSRATR